MTEEYWNALLSTRRQSRELDFHNWDNFDSKAEVIRVVQMAFGAEKKNDFSILAVHFDLVTVP